jgi:hypothetical protein
MGVSIKAVMMATFPDLAAANRRINHIKERADVRPESLRDMVNSVSQDVSKNA